MGSVLNILARTNGKPISYAVYISTLLAISTAIFGLSPQFATTLFAFIGSFIGGVLGIVNDESVNPPSNTEQWEKAQQRVMAKLRQRLGSIDYPQYRNDDRVVIEKEDLHPIKGKKNLYIRIEYWEENRLHVLERHHLMFDRTGDILTDELLPKDPGYESSSETHDN